MPHCTISPHLRAQWDAVTHHWTWWQHQIHFCATLLIMVIEIWFKFQSCVQCAEKAISKIIFKIRWDLKQIWCSRHTWVSKGDIKGFGNSGVWVYPNGPEAGREAGWGSEFVPLKKREVGSFILLHKISRTACCFGIRTFLKQYNCYESATIWYTNHQYLAQYSEIINNLQEIPLIFCNYAVRSCGTWRKGPGQSPCNVLSISDLELYVTETSTGVCDPVTD